MEGKTFYRYASRAEAEAVLETGLLRGGRPGSTYWTDERYESAADAKGLLALGDLPEVRLAFRIRNAPGLVVDGLEVEPDEGEPGGGTEWMTLDAVEVEVMAIDQLD